MNGRVGKREREEEERKKVSRNAICMPRSGKGK